MDGVSSDGASTRMFWFWSFSWGGLADETFLDGSNGDIFVFSPTRCDPHLSDAINPKTRIAFAC
jgi:hypothetical protein